MPSDSVHPRDLTEAALLSECRWEAFRGSGPGGQKRNKTSSCIRLTHLPTGLHVLAGESRSQKENKDRALRRLKLKLAIELRRSIDLRGWEPPPWLDTVRVRPAKETRPGTGYRLAVSDHHPLFFSLAGLLLDLLAATNGNLAHSAGLLGLSTSSTAKFLTIDSHLLTAANQIRKQYSLPGIGVRK